MLRRTIYLSLPLLLLVLTSTNVNGALITMPNQYFNFNGTPSVLKLSDYETAVDPATGSAVGTIAGGDVLEGVFDITQSQGPTRYPNGFDLKGVFEVLVQSVTGTGTDQQFTIVPYAPFGASLGVTGAMIAFYSDVGPVKPFLDTDTAAKQYAEATTGSLYMVLGGTGTWGTDYYWAANGNPDTLASNVSATFDASLQLLVNDTGIPTADFQNVTQSGPAISSDAALGLIENPFGIQGDINRNPYAFTSGGGYISGYNPIQSEDPLTANVVPEPSSIVALIGLVCAGLACNVFTRRRKA